MSNTVLSIKNISKSFGGIQALSDISFDIKRGEIIGLLGANGAGKSTLLKIIGGVEKANEGSIVYEGSLLNNETPHDAQRQGLISVYQELNLFMNMTVAENLFLGREPRTQLGRIDWKKVNNDAAKLLREMEIDIPEKTVLANLGVAKRHMVEIARAIDEKPTVLMLDEPTTVLTEVQIEWLFKKVRELAAAGTTVIYVSHRLDEIIRLCDRCVVLRDGKLSAQLDGNFSKDQIIQAMIGHKVTMEKKKDIRSSDKEVLSCRAICQKGKLQDVSFNLYQGEILGIAGLVGSGRTELLRAICGADPIHSGEILLKGKTVEFHGVHDALKHGIAMLSEDRKQEGLFLDETVLNNLASMTLDEHQKLGFMERKKEIRDAKAVSEQVKLDTSRLAKKVNTLSGGNQQKTVLGKALLTSAEVFMFDEPTRGVDVGAREDIYTAIQMLADIGKSVILVSSDWEELLALSDRLVVMSEGRMVGELKGEEVSEANIMKLATVSNVAGETGTEHKKFSFGSLLNNPTRMFAAALIILVVTGCVCSDTFLSKLNLQNMLRQSFLYILLTMGQLFVVISGCTDLSIVAISTVSGLLGMKVMLTTNNILPGILVMLATGIAISLVNGTLVVKAKLNPLVSTYGVSIVLTGVALLISKVPISPAPEVFGFVAKKSFLGLPIILYIGVSLFLILSFVLNHTRFGRYLYASGENLTAAYWSGLPVVKTRFAAFAISGVMAVLASMYVLGRTGAMESTINVQQMLDSIAYALIGGGSFSGGKGNLAGSVLSVFCVIVLMNILSIFGMGAYAKDTIKSALLIAIIVFQEYRVVKAARAIKN